MSLQSTVQFITDSGKTGLVVSPEAWVFHKGLTFWKRKASSELSKDLYGIWYVLTQLGPFSNQAIASLTKTGQLKPSWFKTFKSNLTDWVINASPHDWLNLEAQEPNGILTKANFMRMLRLLGIQV